MTTYQQPFAAAWDRATAEGQGSLNPSASRFETFSALPDEAGFTTPNFAIELAVLGGEQWYCPWPGGMKFGVAAGAPAGAAAAGAARTSGGGYYNAGGVACFELLESVFVRFGDINNESPCYTFRDRANWTQITTGVGGTNLQQFDNGLTLALVPAVPARPFATIRLDGAALAALSTNMRCFGAVQVRDRWANWGRARFVEYVDDTAGTPTPDTRDNYPFLLGELEKQLVGGVRAFLGTTSGGVGVYADDCAAAYPSVGCMFIRTTDIGNANEQIPAAFADNSAAHFRFFPGAFFRRVPYIRRLEGMEDPMGFFKRANDAFPPGIDAVQTMPLITVLRAPSHSRWGFIIDGQWEEAIIEHPEGSDFRTGLEIWNAVIVPAINTATSRGQSLPFYRAHQPDSVTPGNVIFSQVGLLNRLQYVQFAELLQHYDEDPAVPIYGVIEQNGPA